MRGERVVTAASRKIQQWWRARRPLKTTLEPKEEHTEECSEERVKRTAETQNTGGRKDDEETSEHKQDNNLIDQINEQKSPLKNESNPQQTKTTSDQNSSSQNRPENTPISETDFKRVEETSALDVDDEITFLKNIKTEVQSPPKTKEPSGDVPDKEKLKSSPVNKALTPTENHGNAQNYQAKKNLNDQQAVRAPVNNRKARTVLKKQEDHRGNVDGARKETASKLDTPQAIKQHLKESFEKEKSRKASALNSTIST